MKKIVFTAILASLPTLLPAQSALDAYSLSQGDLRGTARFMSMAGAFTALGGDLTTLSQNPGGIGIYRSSEIGATLDINMQSVTSNFLGNKTKDTQTKVACNNFGYIGTVNLGYSSPMPFFNWGTSYARVASFDRRYRGSASGSHGSLSNYVAGYTASEGWSTADLNAYSSGYNPFFDSYAPWMSVLMYNAYAINPSNNGSTDYEGLYNGTSGSKAFLVQEKGYVDEYNINFGGNVLNTVYWGIGLGITDIDYTNSTVYVEEFDNATIPNSKADGRTNGSANLDYESWKHMSGTGFNFKVGVIVKPINEFRIGFAFHTPTYYNVNYDGWAQTRYAYSSGYDGYFPNNGTAGCDDYFSFKMRTPWRMMIGAAGVLGKEAILSFDYEYRPYQSMNLKDDDGIQYDNMTEDVKTYYKAVNILRLGAEYRLTPNWSIRAGYSWQSTPVEQVAANGMTDIYTSGPDDTETQPSYTFDKTTQYITAGIGFHWKQFYADAAYVHRHRSSTWHAYNAAYDRSTTPSATLSDNQDSIVLSMGFKF